MYEEVIEVKEKPRKEWRLFSVTGLAVVAIVCITALFIGGYMYYGSFRTFVGEFSQTTSINYRKGSVEVTTAEENFNLSTKNIYFVYNCIINAGRGRLGEAPGRTPDAVLKYKYGATLELWDVGLENGKPGVFIRYRGANDYEYAYDTDRLTFGRLPLTARQNKE